MVKESDVDPVLLLLALAQLQKIGWSGSKAIGFYLYSFATSVISAVSEWKADGSKKGRQGDAVPGAVHPKVVPKYL